MILMSGANGNVFGYNYSFDAKSTTEVPPDAIGDMSLHGHYAFANLFEGNIGQNIFIDDFWGPAGPYNTFFRNRSELYGIVIFDQYHYSITSDRQNIVGNEVTNTNSQKGNYLLAGKNHFTYGNNIKGIIQPGGTEALNDSSYYLFSKPYFWNIIGTWPSIGIPNLINTGTNPAYERYFSGSSKISCNKELGGLNAIATADSIACKGGATVVTISAFGGTEPYTGTGVFTVKAGVYNYLVTDGNGKNSTVTISIGETAVLSAATTSINASACNNTLGSIIINNVKGGIPPFQYSLNGVDYSGNNIFNNLFLDTYTPYVKDSAGCADTLSAITIIKSSQMTITAGKTSASSCKNDGSISIRETGGSAPFLFSLNDTNFVSSNVFTQLAAGSYTVWVKDATGCIDSLQSIVITKTKAFTLTVSKTNVTCKNASDGTLTLKIKGGISPYVYSLDSVNFISSKVFTNLPKGTYKAWARDSRECLCSASTTIANGKKSCTATKSVSSSYQPNIFNNFKLIAFPNPSAGEFNFIVQSKTNKEVTIIVVDMYGKTLYQRKGNTNKQYKIGQDFPSGIYIIKVFDGTNMKTIKILKAAGL